MKGGQKMASHGNDSVNENLGAGALSDNMDKKTWRTPLVVKLDVTIHTQDNIVNASDGSQVGSTAS
jgi:hypothetical protein